jgi:thioredoxin-related protein
VLSAQKSLILMKSGFLFIALFIFTSLANAQGVNYLYSWNQAKTLAEKEGKLIFAQVVAEWCEFSSSMIVDINNNPELSEFLTKNFVNFQVDEEYQKSFLRKYKIKSFPVTIFLNSEGDELHRIEGYKGLDKLINEAMKFKEFWDRVSQPDSGSISDKQDSFVEAEFLKEFSDVIILLPEKLSLQKLYNYILKGPPYSTTLFNFIGASIDYSIFSVYIKYEPTVPQVMAEQLMKSFLVKDNNFLCERRIKKGSREVSELTRLESTKCLAYMKAFKEHDLLLNAGRAKDKKLKVFGKSLLQEYPETLDYTLLYKVMVYMALHEDNLDIYRGMNPIFIKLSEERSHFIYEDFLSLIYYKLGEVEQSAIHINKAMQKAEKHVEKFTPLISIYRNREQ